MSDISHIRAQLQELEATVNASLDAAVRDLPEYRALENAKRARPEYGVLAGIRQSLAAMGLPAAQVTPDDQPAQLQESEADTASTTIIGMVTNFIRGAGEPKTTAEVFAHIHAMKAYHDPRRARLTMVSILSKNKKRIKSVKWRNNESAWWLVDVPLPPKRGGSGVGFGGNSPAYSNGGPS